MQKNVLVIGGSYFVGRVFVEEMVASGDVSRLRSKPGKQTAHPGRT